MEEVYISNVNAELINTYCMIRDEIDSVIELLTLAQTEYGPLDIESRKSYYTEKREIQYFKSDAKYSTKH